MRLIQTSNPFRRFISSTKVVNTFDTYKKKYEKELKDIEILSDEEEPVGQDEQKNIDEEINNQPKEVVTPVYEPTKEQEDLEFVPIKKK